MSRRVASSQVWRGRTAGPVALALGLALTYLLLGASSAPGSADVYAAARSSPAEQLARVTSAAEPGRDPVDLAMRLRGAPAPPPVLAAEPPTVGDVRSFSILDQRSARLFTADAELRFVSPHVYWFVQSTLAARAPQADLERSAATFESNTYPLIHQYFGTEPSPGVDGDPRIVFLLGDVPGVAAYFSSADAYPRAVNPRSNEHEMIYVNLNALRPGQSSFDSTIAHELQHMVRFDQCPTQEGWVDEGASELAVRVAGFDGAQPAAFASHPDVQLNAWTANQSDLNRHYQASYLFLRYVAERAGGWDALPRLFETCARGEALFQAFLQRQPIAPDLDSLFADWTVANLLQDGSIADGRYAYAGGGFHAAVTGAATADAPFLGSVAQYAANYVELPSTGEGGTATFAGDPSVAALSAPVDNAGIWWSNRGDSLDTRLTRQVDLSSVRSATLQFRAWYDLEDEFDFVYLTGSRDGGRTWQVLPGRLSKPDQATGNNFGPGWTGASGPDWLDEQVDLTPLAGGPALLRFEYVTDQSYNGQGFAFRDLRIPELGLSEVGADENRWSAEGWVRVDASLPERWNLRLVRWTPDGVFVDAVPVAPDGTVTFARDPRATRSVLAIAPTAPRTLLAADYSLTLGP